VVSFGSAEGAAARTKERVPPTLPATPLRWKIWVHMTGFLHLTARHMGNVHGVDSPVRAGEAEGSIVHPATPDRITRTHTLPTQSDGR
jgi:hypothetical protein